MNRRAFLQRPLVPAAPALTGDPERPENVFMNQELPRNSRSRAGLESYTGPWGFQEAAHLLRRCMFGPTRMDVLAAMQAGLQATLDQLFAPQPVPAPPVNYQYASDPNVPVGQTWVTAPESPNVNTYRKNSLAAWTITQLVQSPVSLQEMMTLFWHNHFVTEIDVVNQAKYMYQYISLLRSHALGNFRTLTQEITVNPAMLMYLNGNDNTNQAPNENYARELFELFTIGKGPTIGPGDYTNYTEQDVQAAAKVLTGWRDRYNRNVVGSPYSEFVASRHDTSIKQFTQAFDNTAIANNGDQEYKDLITMIFAQRETARFICRKLYRWFVYYVIDTEAETNVIEPMAQSLIDNNFEIMPPLRALLSSAHFHDVLTQGCKIKNPLDYTVGMMRQMKVTFPATSQLAAQYVMYNFVNQGAAAQQMQYFLPPNVAGWAAYYQQPGYYELWINSATLPLRVQLADLMATTGYIRNGFTLKIDPLPLVAELTDPMDPNVVVAEFVQLMLPQPLTPNQLDYLKEALLPGLPDYEWGIEYSDYLGNPNDVNLRNAVVSKLQALIRTIMNLAEYQLA
ncbi:MAG: DUF1800 domain-containing protein [Bacteroidetes bacterium]|nr:MAG: DUF1800 domain-containing protein [Bacteroidota bacterium]